MATGPLRIWCNTLFPPSAQALLEKGTAGHQLVMASDIPPSILHVGQGDRQLADADIAFGQVAPEAVMNLPHLRWMHITTAGYERYDRDDFRQHMKNQRVLFTNSSGVYDEPCAQHLLAMMLTHSRDMTSAWHDQQTNHAWPTTPIRARSYLLAGQSVLFLSFGAIAQRLAELLRPFGMNMSAVRRTPAGNDSVPTFTQEHLPRLLAQADHVINILPGGSQTHHFMNATLFAAMKPSAIFYNAGRGATVDQEALLAALRNGRLAAAYLDVTTPEPLPPDHPLWTAPHCFITPHTAGGHVDEMQRIVQHFLLNLQRFSAGQELANRIM